MKRFFNQLWLILALDCEKSAQLTSESLDRPLHWSEKWAVRLHRLICSQSRQLDKQLILLDGAINKLMSGDELARWVVGLPGEARQRISQKLRERQSE